jgi:DNA-binding CsgD family transcriptional regulator
MEAASRWVLAAEAWIDLAEIASGAVVTRALGRAAEICEQRELSWVRRRLDEVTARLRAAPAHADVPSAFARLTPRQRDIATLVAQGRSNQEIADQLFLSVHTVRNQLVAVFDVLGVSRRAEIAALAARG